MSQLFGASSTPASTSTAPAATSLRVQTAIEGKPRPLLYGRTRFACNLIWYNDFYSVTVQAGGSAPASGGKGGIFSPSTNAGGGSSSYNYFVSVILAMGEGPVFSFTGRAWSSKSQTTLQALNLGQFTGQDTQTAWSYLTTAHPDQALAYRLTAYVAGNMALGTSTELPNLTFEATGAVTQNGAAGVYDALPTLMLVDYLSDGFHGVPGWSTAFNGDWTIAANYVGAAGLYVSVFLANQTSASSFLQEFIESLNLLPVWSDGVLKLVPRGDQLISADGFTYVPPNAPLYDLNDDDFLPNQCSFGSVNSDPVAVQRKAPRQLNNIVQVGYLDRATDYNPAQVPAQDDGAVLLYGQRNSKGVRSWPWFQTATSASMAASLALGRERVANVYGFTVRPRFILLDPGDIIAITDLNVGLNQQWVRIQEIDENADRSLNIIAEEVLDGSGGAPTYGRQTPQGPRPDYNASPGAINAPIIFEPTDELAGGLAVWLAVSGASTLYGGYDLYVSTDNQTYDFAGRQRGSSRTGVLTTQLASVSVNQTGPTIDTVNTFGVDLTESRGQLGSTTQAGALALNTACYVGGEIVAYETATLTATDKYTLSYLVRGAYGTEDDIATHAIGTRFVPLDGTIMKLPFDQSRIGQTIYLKFVPFNIWGGGGLTTADVPFYTYTITGEALASPLPQVTKLRTVFEAGFRKLWWEEVSDFRTGVRYIVKKGDTYTGAQTLGDLAHPPFIVFGDGTYWISAYCQPVAGLLVYSETPASIVISGNMLVANLLTTVDYGALGWLGTFSNVGKEGVDPTALLRLTGTENILTDPDILNNPDILNSGGIALSGTWQSSEVIDIGYVADAYCNASWLSTGLPVGQNVLSIADFLNDPDVLSAASAQFAKATIQIRFASTAINDAFAPTDLFAEPDAFLTGVQWSDWQDFVPGVYRCRFVQLQANLQTVDPKIIGYLLSLSLQISIPARIDHYLNNTVPSGGLTITFEPDDASSPAPFNGGPRVGGNFNHPLPAISMDWAGQPGVNFVIDSLSLSQVTFHFVDGTNTPVTVTGVNIYAEGY